MLVKLLKTVFQCNKKHFLVSNKVLFSLYGKLLKMCLKIADENPLRGAKPRWSPQR